MDSFFTGSVQSWLAVAATTLGPLVAFMVGFERTDRFLCRRLAEICDYGGAKGKNDWREGMVTGSD